MSKKKHKCTEVVNALSFVPINNLAIKRILKEIKLVVETNLLSSNNMQVQYLAEHFTNITG